MSLRWPFKDPDEVLDYQFDWTERLEVGETLTSSAFTIAEGTVTKDSQTYAPSGTSTVWLSGGTLGEKCLITNRVTTSAGRTYDESAHLRIRSK